MKLRWLSALVILVVGTIATDAQQPQSAPPQPPAQPQPAGKPANIDRNGVLMLVRSMILALDQANKTGNYTVLRDLGAPAFRSTPPRAWRKSLPRSAPTSSTSRESR
jgi:hypothetical protein